ncbi:MAG TPA: Gfo/Idh/MocA family protein [Candidatus Hypogeohydataceae bacterium YC41]
MESRKVKVAVIGVGHLGKEHARIYSQLPDVELVGVVDTDRERGEQVAQRLKVQFFPEAEEVADKVSAVSVAVPTSAHYPVASYFLKKAIPVMLEKPVGLNLKEAEELVELSARNKVILQIGHVERFNPALQAIERYPMIPRFIECHRLSAFNFRTKDIGVVLDLMIHDIDIILHLARSEVKKVEAVGTRIISNKEDIANARIIFENGCVANLTASRVSFRPMRKIRIFSENTYISLDYEKQEAIIYKKSPRLTLESINPEKLGIKSLTDLKSFDFGDLLEIKHITMNNEEPLKKELESFIECVRENRRPAVSGEEGLRALRVATDVLNDMEQSLKLMGV